MKIIERRGGDLNSREAEPHELSSPIFTPKQLNDFLSLRELEGICNDWLKGIKRYLVRYLDYLDWKENKDKTIEYLKSEFSKMSISTYRKETYQIRRFLNYCGIKWINEIKLPREPETRIKRVTKEVINETMKILEAKKENERFKALVLFGATSGLRAEELYQLEPKDIDLNKKIVHVNHDPKNGQTTKTKKGRISFFSKDAKKAIEKYMTMYQNDERYAHLFTKIQCEKALRGSPIQVKDLRKFFSQEWDRRGGPTSIKKILMGHSLRNDVDLMHYNTQSEEDLKIIYKKVMGITFDD